MAKKSSSKNAKRASDLRYEIKKIYKEAGYSEEIAKSQAHEIVSQLTPSKLRKAKPSQLIPQEVKEKRIFKKELQKAYEKDKAEREERYKRAREAQKEVEESFTKKEIERLEKLNMREYIGSGELAVSRLEEVLSHYPSDAQPIIGGWIDRMETANISREDIGEAISRAGQAGDMFTRSIAYDEAQLEALVGSFADFLVGVLGEQIGAEDFAEVSDSIDSWSSEL